MQKCDLNNGDVFTLFLRKYPTLRQQLVTVAQLEEPDEEYIDILLYLLRRDGTDEAVAKGALEAMIDYHTCEVPEAVNMSPLLEIEG